VSSWMEHLGSDLLPVGCQKSVGTVTSSFRLTEGFDGYLPRRGQASRCARRPSTSITGSQPDESWFPLPTASVRQVDRLADAVGFGKG
jgi:hypothetical protein